MRKRHRSLNSSDLTSKIPEKRRRHGSESNISSSINDPYIEINHHEGTLKKFSTNYFVTEFILKNAISYPEEKLKEIFEKLIDDAYLKSNKAGEQVNNSKFKINFI